MSKNEEVSVPAQIPSKDLPFSFKYKGKTYGKIYEGDFVIRVPSVRALSAIGVERGRLGNGVPSEWLDSETQELHYAVAFLRVCLIKAPKWFTNMPDDEEEPGIDYGLDTEDYGIAYEMFKQGNKLIEAWRKALKVGKSGKKG